MSYGYTPRARAKEALADMGFRPEFDSDGDIKYKSEGVSLYVHTSGEDENFFQVFAVCRSYSDRGTNLERANHIAKSWKCTKLMVFDDGVQVTDEFFSSPGDNIRYVLGRATSAVTGAAKQYLSN